MTTNWTKTKKEFLVKKRYHYENRKKKALKSIKAESLRDLDLLLKSRHQEL